MLISVRPEEIFNEWELSIAERDFEKAERLKNEIEAGIDDEQLHQEKYFILLAKYYIHMLQISNAETQEIIKKISGFCDENAIFYYHYLNGSYLYNEKRYEDALDSYILAEKHLEGLLQGDRGDLNYKIASVYYHMDELVISVKYAEQALLDFQGQRYSFPSRQGDCKMLIALNYVDMKQFELAEEEFHTARSLANQSLNRGLMARVDHNLGLMYAEQNLSEAAIRYLKNVVNSGNHDNTMNTMQTIFLLAREHFKLERASLADEWLTKGKEMAKSVNDNEYCLKFDLLEAIYINKKNKECIFKQAISYFVEENLWVNAEEYAQIYARLLLQEQTYKKATQYYEIALEARNKIKKMEGLK